MRTAFLMMGAASFMALATEASHAQVIVTPLQTSAERMIIVPANAATGVPVYIGRSAAYGHSVSSSQFKPNSLDQHPSGGDAQELEDFIP